MSKTLETTERTAYRHRVALVRSRERDRLNFVVARDGLTKGIEFAQRTLRQYAACLHYRNRSHVGSKYHFARNKEYRHEFVGSVLELSLFLRKTAAAGEAHASLAL